MSVRTELLPVADSLRALRGPSGFDIQTVQLKIVKRAWAGGKRGLGALTETVLTELLQQYRIRSVTTHEVASSGGRFEMEDQKVGPITPSFDGGSGGGYSPDDLKPQGLTGSEIVYVLTGTVAGDYQLIALNSEKAFSYYLVLRRMRTTP